MQSSLLQGKYSLPARHEYSRQFVGKPFTSRPSQRGQLQVVAVKGKGKKQALQQQAQQGGPPAMATPDVDLDNVEFVIFVKATQFPQWRPVTILKAGSAANALVRGLETEWGKRLYAKTLIRNIAQGIYRDKGPIEKQIRATARSGLVITGFQYAFKIRDKTDPKSWSSTEGLTVLPPESKLGTSFLEQLRNKIRGPGN